MSKIEIGKTYYSKNIPEVHIKIDSITTHLYGDEFAWYTYVQMPNDQEYRRVGDKEFVRVVDLEKFYELIYMVEGFEV